MAKYDVIMDAGDDLEIEAGALQVDDYNNLVFVKNGVTTAVVAGKRWLAVVEK